MTRRDLIKRAMGLLAAVPFAHAAGTRIFGMVSSVSAKFAAGLKQAKAEPGERA